MYSDLARESERLHRIIENMLALARVQAGQAPATELLLLDKMLEASSARLTQEMQGINLAVDSAPRDILVECVERYVEQILNNLVENARKYSPANSPIEVTAEVRSESVAISVSDRGMGVHDPEALFQPFWREQ
jgi:K+-sensing histidine kinase KdpD